ncbi:MAG: type I-D CRISPR-associated helicase Cas3' [Thermoflexales bacterium]|nr:type I-D CRISPR-associated helicase Cas3' [Thermoflexales bacterium]
MKITTLPVYSKLADEAEVRELSLWDSLPLKPDGSRWQLSQHQVETYEALTGGEYDVVFNTAMTGDGKSLAAYLRTLVDGRSVLAMYPTNELARDQEAQLDGSKKQWHCEQVRVTPMSAGRMEAIIATGSYSRKADVIRHLADNNDVVLTNPDIFHYLTQFFYTRQGDAPDMLFSRKIVDLFELFVFDEFHIFQVPQIVAVLNALLLVREVSGMTSPKRFLFLSATPDPLLQEYLAKAGFHVKLIQPESESWYRHTFELVDRDQWRPIVQATDIHFWNTQGDYRAEAWATDHLEDVLLAFFRHHRPGAKGAIIVNSIATAHRLFALLGPAFGAEGLCVSLNTGFTGETLKRASLEADLLIGTATVDVGVDFRINFLVFESRDAGTFLQRLGRLGRHTDDGRGHAFEAFEAHALVPNFVNERLFEGKGGESPLLPDSTAVARAELGKAVHTAYPQPVSFQSYAREWGWVQSAHVYYKLSRKTIKDSYETAREHLKQHYWDVLGISTGRALREYAELTKDARQIAEEAQSFRGGSPFECGLIDDSEAGADSVKRYNLLTLAANANLEWLGQERFKREAAQRKATLSTAAMEQMTGWFRFRGFGDAWRAVVILLRESVGSWSADELGEPQVIDGVELDVSGVDWLNELNVHLRRRKFVATLCLIHPNDLRYRLRLPRMFELLPFVARDGAEGSIAFAREALLLSVALKERRVPCGGGAVIV